MKSDYTEAGIRRQLAFLQSEEFFSTFDGGAPVTKDWAEDFFKAVSGIPYSALESQDWLTQALLRGDLPFLVENLNRGGLVSVFDLRRTKTNNASILNKEAVLKGKIKEVEDLISSHAFQDYSATYADRVSLQGKLKNLQMTTEAAGFRTFTKRTEAAVEMVDNMYFTDKVNLKWVPPTLLDLGIRSYQDSKGATSRKNTRAVVLMLTELTRPESVERA